MKSFKKITTRKFYEQYERCFYCDQPMWLSEADNFAKTYGLTEKRARYLRATAEHLIARSAGGSDGPKNIVAACLYCNTVRHKCLHPLDPPDYQTKVRKRLADGKWHQLRLTL